MRLPEGRPVGERLAHRIFPGWLWFLDQASAAKQGTHPVQETALEESAPADVGENAFQHWGGVVKELLANPSQGEWSTEGWWFAIHNSKALLRNGLGAGSDAWSRLDPEISSRGWTVVASDSIHERKAHGMLVEVAEWDESNLLDLDLDLAVLGNRLAWPSAASLPKVHWYQYLTNDVVRVQAELDFPEPLNLELEGWRIPKSEVRPPLVQFQVVRGIAPVLARTALGKALFGENPVNQFALWGQPLVPFRTWFSVPIAEDQAPEVLRNLHDLLLPWFDGSRGTNGAVMGRLTLAGDEKAVAIQNIERIIHPVLGQVTLGEDSFLFGTFFQPAPSESGLPEGLEAQIDRDDLVFYDFEITSEAAVHWNAFVQFRHMMFGRLPSARNPIAQRWLQAAVPSAGETVTEVVQTSEHQLTLRRRGPFGVSALELVALVRWLDGPLDRVGHRPVPSILPGSKSEASAETPGTPRPGVPGSRTEIRKPLPADSEAARTRKPLPPAQNSTIRKAPGRPAGPALRQDAPSTTAPENPSISGSSPEKDNEP